MMFCGQVLRLLDETRKAREKKAEKKEEKKEDKKEVKEIVKKPKEEIRVSVADVALSTIYSFVSRVLHSILLNPIVVSIFVASLSSWY